MATFTSRRFNQDASGAKRAAADGPVFITDRGRPAHVLMTIEEYRRLTEQVMDGPMHSLKLSIVDMLAMDGAGDIDFDPPRSRELPRIPDLE